MGDQLPDAAARAQIRVTDNRWSAFLRDHEEIFEANFWIPSGQGFAALSSGDPILFKARGQRRLIGGGRFVRFWQMRVSEAWTYWGMGNGVPTEAAFHAIIQEARYGLRKDFVDDPVVGRALRVVGVARNRYSASHGPSLGIRRIGSGRNRCAALSSVDCNATNRARCVSQGT